MRESNFVCVINIDGEDAIEWNPLRIAREKDDSVDISCYIEAIPDKSWHVSICRLPDPKDSHLNGLDVECVVHVDGEYIRKRTFNSQEFKTATVHGRRVSAVLEEPFVFGSPSVQLPPEPGTLTPEEEMEMVRDQEVKSKNGGISSIRIGLYAGTVGERRRTVPYRSRRDIDRKSTAPAKKGDALISNSTHFGQARYSKMGPSMAFYKFRSTPDITFTFMYKTRLLLEIEDIIPRRYWIERALDEEYDYNTNRLKKRKSRTDSAMDVDSDCEEGQIIEGQRVPRKKQKEVIVIED